MINKLEKCNIKKLWTNLFTLVSFFASLIVIILYFKNNPQEQLANKQLQQMEAKAEINIKLNPMTESLLFGVTTTEPFSFDVVPRNIGSLDTSSWKVVFIFCNGTKVLEHDPKWVQNGVFLTYDSENLLSHEQSVFNDSLDSIGKFKINFSTKPNTFPTSIPFLIFQSSGQNTIPTGYLASIKIDSLKNATIEYSYDKDIFIKSGCIKAN